MKPRITFQSGSEVIISNTKEFHELPPINQVLELRGERYKIIRYESATIIVEPHIEPEAAPQKKSPRAKRVEKKQARIQRKEARAAKSKPAAKSDSKPVFHPTNRRN